MPGFASRRVKPGLFVLSRAAVVAKKTARRCNIFPLAVSKGKKFQVMNKLICHVGLLCGVLLGMLDATFAQSFAVQRVGCGKQAVILIPGFACSGDVWRQTVDALRENYTCYVLTMPGFAGVAAETNPSFDGWTRQIVDFIRDERIEKPVLIGHSMGGGLVMNIAANHAELVKGIVVVDALPCLAALYDPDFRAREIPDEEFAQAEARLLRMSDEQFRRQARISAAALTTDSLRYDDLIGWSLASDRRTWARMYCDYSNVDLRPAVRRISVPMLVLLEYPFRKIAPAVEQQFAGRPNIRLEYANRGLHFIMFDDREWYMRQITDFLND